MVAVGTIIADRPPHRSVQAALPHTAPTLEKASNATTRTPLIPWNTHSISRAVSGECGTERCSPWPAPFSPQTPSKIALLCSSGSSIVWRGPTPPERARLPCGLRLRRPASFPCGPRRSGGLPVLVHVVSQSARVLRLRRTNCSLAIIAKQSCCLPPTRRESAS